MTFKLSKHITPRRNLRYFGRLLIHSAFSYVIYRIITLIFSPTFGAPLANLLLVLFIAGAVAAFFAALEAVRLSRDATIFKSFMNATSDGSYDKKEESKFLWRCDELWNDAGMLALLYLIYMVIAHIALALLLLSDPVFSVGETKAVILGMLPYNLCGYVFLIAFYVLFHHGFTLRVHTMWNGERMHKAEAVTEEKLPYM